MRRAILLLLLLNAPQAWGNFGSYAGGWSSEPTGLENIRIVSESLTIDLRACDGSQLAKHSDMPLPPQPVGKVEAVYHLYNHGSEREVHLVFSAGTDIDENEVGIRLENSPLSVQRDSVDKLRWNVPSQTPAIDGSGARRFTYAYKRANFAVRAKIPAGSSTLRVLFRTLIGNDRSSRPVCCWQFIYLLAPARDWGGFDKLDVKVLLPAGWEAACNLELQRQGDALTGAFDSIPDDVLSLTIRMPVGPVQERIDRVQQLARLGILLGIPLVLLVARLIVARMRGFKGRASLAWSFLLANVAVWGTAAWWCAYCFVIFPFVAAPPLQQATAGWVVSPEDVVWFFAVVFAIVGTIVSYLFAWCRIRPTRTA